MFINHLLSILVFLPLVGALALPPLRNRDQHLLIRWISLAVVVIVFLLSFIPVDYIPPGASGFKLEEFVPWIPQWHVNYHLGTDGISIFIIHLITLLTPIGVLCSWNEVKKQVKEFHIMLLLLEMSVVGILVSFGLLLFFFWWEISLVPLALLIGIWGHDRKIYA